MFPPVTKLSIDAVGYGATGDERRGTGFFRLTDGANEWSS
jgi:hypothetical protein